MGDVVVTQEDGGPNHSPIFDVLWPLLGGNHTEAEVWNEIADALEQERAQARKQALEEAAKVADYRGMQYAGLREGMLFDCLAAVIRAIGDKE